MSGARGIVIAVVAALVVGFSAGLVAGIVFMRFGPPLPPPFAGPGRPGHDAPHAEGPGPLGMGPMGMGPGSRMMPGPLLARLERELDLTPAQRDRILTALREVRARHVALRESTHAAIQRELTGSQRARWRELMTEYPRSWRGRAGRPFRDEGRHAGEGPPPEETP
jgi:hypothetical protein